MGLDMYAYVASCANQQREYYNTVELNEDTGDHSSVTVTKPREIAYWRKHPNFHGFMERLWLRKQNIPVNSQDRFIEGRLSPGDFNGVELELTREDLDELEHAVVNQRLPGTSGFFFGGDADDRYREHDLAFIRNARAEMFFGLKVFYNSSW